MNTEPLMSPEITPEAFMALPPDPIEEAEADFAHGLEVRSDEMWILPPDPLVSIAESLRALVGQIAPGAFDDPRAEEIADLRQELEVTIALNEVRQGQLEQVLEICKPSTSKLADRIRAVLGHAAPVTPEASPEPAPAAVTEPVIGRPDGGDPIENWRAYGRSQGLEGVEEMNRSQIRTALGIDHGEAVPS